MDKSDMLGNTILHYAARSTSMATVDLILAYEVRCIYIIHSVVLQFILVVMSVKAFFVSVAFLWRNANIIY